MVSFSRIIAVLCDIYFINIMSNNKFFGGCKFIQNLHIVNFVLWPTQCIKTGLFLILLLLSSRTLTAKLTICHIVLLTLHSPSTFTIGQ